MVKGSFADRLKNARELPSYWVEKAVLEFTSKLWSSMKQKGLTQAQLASKVDKQAPYVNRVLNGNHNVTLKTMVTLAHAVELELKIDLVEKTNFQKTITAASLVNHSSITKTAGHQSGLRLISTKSYATPANDEYGNLAA